MARAARPLKSPPPRVRQRQRADGTWRIWWEPETALRAQGFVPVELDPARLTWTAREAARLNGLVDAARGKAGAALPASGPAGRSVKDLIGAWQASTKWPANPSTQEDYRKALRSIEAKWGGRRVADLTKPAIFDWYETLHRDRGPWVAAKLVRVLSALLSYGERKGWRPDNPCLRLGVETPPRRQRVATWEELDALLAAALRLGRPSVALAVALGVFAGQRQKDVLGARISDMADGTWRVLRSKKQNLGALRLHPEILPWLARAGEGRAPDDVAVRNEETGKPYRGTTFQHVFARVRAEAAKVSPGLSDLQYRDLRRTFGHLARIGGAHERQVGDALGNTAWTDPAISGTYMPATAETAARAIDAIQRPARKEVG